MADIDLTIKSSIETATSLKAYALQKPVDVTDSCVVYQIISEHKRMSMSGAVDLKTVRVQITSISDTYATLKTIIGQIETLFWGTTTPWIVSVPIDTKLESKENNLYFDIQEYYIFYK
jgi:hypothetical protein